MRGTRFRCEFQYDRLREDLEGRFGIPLASLPEQLKEYFGETVHRTTIYSWFSRRQLTLARFMQLSSLVRRKTEGAEQLDFSEYMKLTVRGGRLH